MGSAQRWIANTDDKCAVYISSGSVAEFSEKGFGIGFAWARIGVTLFYSYYYTPNCTIQAFDQFLSGLEASIRSHAVAGVDFVVAGDFNSYSTEWGSATDDARRSLLFGFAVSLEFTVCRLHADVQEGKRHLND